MLSLLGVQRPVDETLLLISSSVTAKWEYDQA